MPGRRLDALVLLPHLRDVLAAVLAPRFGVEVVHAISSSLDSVSIDGAAVSSPTEAETRRVD
jgi:hypothetical protein